MIKAAFKNYGKHYKSLLIVIGIIYATLIGIFTFIHIRFKGALLDSSDSVIREFGKILTSAVSSVDIKEFFTAGFIKSCAKSFRDSYNISFSTSSKSLGVALIASLVVLLLAVQISVWVCRFVMRKNVERRSTRKGIIAFAIRYGISALFAAIVVYCVYNFFFSLYIFLVVFLVIKAVQNIIEVKYIYFRNKPLKELLTKKNVLMYIVSTALFFLATLLVVIILSFLTNFYIAILICLPLFVYYFEIVYFTTVEYFMAKYKRA